MDDETTMVNLETFESYARTTTFEIRLPDDTPILLPDESTRIVSGGFGWTTKARLQNLINNKLIGDEMTFAGWQSAILSL